MDQVDNNGVRGAAGHDRGYGLLPTFAHAGGIARAAGVGGGITGSVAGLSSIVSYPVLLAVGLPPISANVSNTVALVFSGVGAASGSAASRPPSATH